MGALYSKVALSEADSSHLEDGTFIPENGCPQRNLIRNCYFGIISCVNKPSANISFPRCFPICLRMGNSLNLEVECGFWRLELSVPRVYEDFLCICFCKTHFHVKMSCESKDSSRVRGAVGLEGCGSCDDPGNMPRNKVSWKGTLCTKSCLTSFTTI